MRMHSRRYDIVSVPTCILFEAGKPTKALVGKFTAATLDAFVAESSVRGVVSPTTWAA